MMAGSQRSSYQTPRPDHIPTLPPKDSAVICSIALQHSVPVEVIRKALLRDPRGRASSPLGAALDIIVGGPVP
jgi:hypothetical protein